MGSNPNPKPYSLNFFELKPEPKFTFLNLIKAETESFVRLVKVRKFVLEVISSRDFWFSNMERYPISSHLAMHLLAIPSLSAFIESFFSVNDLFVISIQIFRMNFSNIDICLRQT